MKLDLTDKEKQKFTEIVEYLQKREAIDHNIRLGEQNEMIRRKYGKEKIMKLLIKQCDDHLLWYADKIGQTVPFVKDDGDVFWSREPKGMLNIVFKKDAEIIEED